MAVIEGETWSWKNNESTAAASTIPVNIETKFEDTDGKVSKINEDSNNAYERAAENARPQR